MYFNDILKKRISLRHPGVL